MVVRERLGKDDVSSQEMGMTLSEFCLLTEGYTLEGCPEELQDAWALLPVENPLKPTNARNRSLFSGPGLLSIQSQLANLVIRPTENHVSYLCQVGHTQRQVAQTLLEEARQAALEKQRKKDSTPRKSSSTIEVLSTKTIRRRTKTTKSSST